MVRALTLPSHHLVNFELKKNMTSTQRKRGVQEPERPYRSSSPRTMKPSWLQAALLDKCEHRPAGPRTTMLSKALSRDSHSTLQFSLKMNYINPGQCLSVCGLFANHGSQVSGYLNYTTIPLLLLIFNQIKKQQEVHQIFF